MGFADIVVIRLNWEKCERGKTFFHEPPRAEPLASVCLDWNNSQWVARANGQQIRAVLGSLSGSLIANGIDVDLVGMRSEVCMSLGAYLAESPAPRHGNAWRGHHETVPNMRGYRSHWWRTLDPSGMTPFDKMAEMINLACTDKRLRAKLAAELGGMANPAILLPLAGIFLAFFGAEYLGIVGLVSAIRTLLNLGQAHEAYTFYEPRGRELSRILMNSCTERNLYEGAEIFQEIIVRVVTDIGSQLAMSGVQKAGAIAWRKICDLFPQGTQKFIDAARQRKAENESRHAKASAKRNNVKGVELLRELSDPPFRSEEIKAFKQISNMHDEMIVIRDPGHARLAALKNHIWVGGKMTWLKAKAKYGFFDMVCVPKANIPDVHMLKRAPARYKSGNLKGMHPDLDKFIAKHPELDMYEMPRDGRPIGAIEDGKFKADIDYSSMRSKNYQELEGQFLVDLGDGRMLVVDKVRGPWMGDVDIATRQRLGSQQAGDHLPNSAHKNSPKEDNFNLEQEINRTVVALDPSGNTHLYDVAQHGGGGASTVHVREAQAAKVGHWSPRTKDGSFQAEKLYVVLPTKPGFFCFGRKESKMFEFSGWGDFEKFCGMNHLEFPF